MAGDKTCRPLSFFKRIFLSIEVTGFVYLFDYLSKKMSSGGEAQAACQTPRTRPDLEEVPGLTLSRQSIKAPPLFTLVIIPNDHSIAFRFFTW